MAIETAALVALTIDLGSERNLTEIRQRALDVGAVGLPLRSGPRGAG